MNDNGQGISVSPQQVIDALMQRVQQLTMENVMLQAALQAQAPTKEDADAESG